MEFLVKKKDIPARYVLTFLGSLGFAILYAMRINLSVAMVAMVRSANDSSSNSTNIEGCEELIPKLTANSSYLKEEERTGEFDWDSNTQASILGCFFYGSCITQIPGGVMAEKFGGKWLFGVAVLMNSLLNLLIPLAARMSPRALITVLVVDGLAQGVTLPAMNCLIGKWAPICERSRIGTIIFTGVQVGTVLGTGISGTLCASTFLGGWPSGFYVFGFWGCIWFIFWSFLIHETFLEHPRISDYELTYIRDNQEEQRNNKSVPWKSIFSSIPVWGLSLTYFGQMWGFFVIFLEMPSYLSSILHFDIQKIGMLSVMPFVAQTVISWLSGFMADKLRSQGNLKITTIRKIFNSIGSFGPGLLLLSLVFAGCRPNVVVAIISATVGLSGFGQAGFLVTHVDMCPKYASILMGITCTVSAMAGFVVPAVVGLVIGNEKTRRNWGIVFIITSGVYFVTGIIYDVFCTAEEQSWGTPTEDEQDDGCGEIQQVRTAEDASVEPAKC